MGITPKTDGASTGWRTICFQLPWQQKQEPDWSIGTQIAGEIIAPILANSQLNILYWRFHRRATKDAVGHTFSFMVYSSAQSAEKIYADINTNPSTIALKKTGHITGIVFDPLDKNPKPDIKDTSDPLWPVAIQKTWPNFIMGASQMWLNLILQLKTESPANDNYREYYQRIHQQITKLWEQHGQHAMLHHLSALYGYSPVAVNF